jgi:hypothetical protein
MTPSMRQYAGRAGAATLVPGNPLGTSSLDVGGLGDLDARNLDLHQSGAGVLRLSERGERKYKNECGAQGFRTHSYLPSMNVSRAHHS